MIVGAPTTVSAVLATGHNADAALRAPESQDLTFRDLRTHVEQTVVALNRRGIGRGDRVAIVLPNGPEMASAFVSIAAGATTAPLNPGYRRKEFDFYLDDLNARALVVRDGDDSPAVAAAEALGIQVLRLQPGADGLPGQFSFQAATTPPAAPTHPGLAEPDDIALVLHTSGTTSRPKIVPLRHRNICASAQNIAATLHLTRGDRGLNVMPLFHIHGLMACVLAPLSAGSSVFYTSGFHALKFYGWLAEARPTWYSAVPTMHQAILARAARNVEVLDGTNLRFIRSSSASLPTPVMMQLEKTFDAPVVEAYAMTEAAHQMTCNPLPPGVRKAGTVGPAAGPDVAIMDAAGLLLDAGDTGEIVIRGPNVTSGYENNPEANAAAFSDGWFRTGDQGVMDADGYVTVTGRLKEIINRGGEKISPREVDDVLMDHPAVQQVVTFALPHEKLGEEVAAAVVLEEGHEASAADIVAFAATRIAAFKVPKTVVILNEIPKGPTGKLRRIGLAEQLGLA